MKRSGTIAHMMLATDVAIKMARGRASKDVILSIVSPEQNLVMLLSRNLWTIKDARQYHGESPSVDQCSKKASLSPWPSSDNKAPC